MANVQMSILFNGISNGDHPQVFTNEREMRKAVEVMREQMPNDRIVLKKGFGRGIYSVNIISAGSMYGKNNPLALERKLKREYSGNNRAVYGTLNKLGLMRGNKVVRSRNPRFVDRENMRTQKKYDVYTYPNGKVVGVVRAYSLTEARKKAATEFKGQNVYPVLSHSNPDFDSDSYFEPIEQTFDVIKLDLSTGEETPVASDVCAENLPAITAALESQVEGEECHINVRPSGEGEVDGEFDEVLTESNPRKVRKNPRGSQERINRIWDTNSKIPRVIGGFPTKAKVSSAKKGFIGDYKNLKTVQGTDGRYPGSHWLLFGTPRRSGNKSNPGRKTKSRSNPEFVDTSEAATKLYKVFQGDSPEDSIEFTEQTVTPSNYVRLGELVSIQLKPVNGGRIKILGFPGSPESDIVYLTTSADGRQLYFLGGAQEQNLNKFELTKEQKTKHLVTLGRLKAFCYQTEKKMHDFELTDYTHKSGENLDSSGKRYMSKDPLPCLVYDTLNHRLNVTGGAYFITQRGIEN